MKKNKKNHNNKKKAIPPSLPKKKRTPTTPQTEVPTEVKKILFKVEVLIWLLLFVRIDLAMDLQKFSWSLKLKV